VIGFVGSDEKRDWCKNELGFDHVFNYKSIHFSEALKQGEFVRFSVLIVIF
jgi:NADPH-dependent curcumin reductase CurA